MENKRASVSVVGVTPQGIATLLESGDLKIELSTVQEETLFDQNEFVENPGDGCYCNPGQSCC